MEKRRLSKTEVFQVDHVDILYQFLRRFRGLPDTPTLLQTNYAYDMDSGAPVPGARVVPVDADGNGRADTGEVYDTKDQAVEGVGMGLYPSPPARDLNVVTPGKPAGLTAAFIRWILTGGQVYVDEAGYIALPDAQLASELAKLD